MPLSKIPGACALGSNLVRFSAVRRCRRRSAQATLTPSDTLLPTAGTKEIGIAGNYSLQRRPSPISFQGQLRRVHRADGRIRRRRGDFGGRPIPRPLRRWGRSPTTTSRAQPTVPAAALPGRVRRLLACPRRQLLRSAAQGGVKYFFNPNIALNRRTELPRRPPLVGPRPIWFWACPPSSARARKAGAGGLPPARSARTV